MFDSICYHSNKNNQKPWLLETIYSLILQAPLKCQLWMCWIPKRVAQPPPSENSPKRYEYVIGISMEKTKSSRLTVCFWRWRPQLPKLKTVHCLTISIRTRPATRASSCPAMLSNQTLLFLDFITSHEEGSRGHLSTPGSGIYIHTHWLTTMEASLCLKDNACMLSNSNRHINLSILNFLKKI